MSEKGYGWRPDPPDFRDYIYGSVNHPLTLESNAVKHQARDYFADKVLDQGQLGSCVWNGIPSVLRYERHLLGQPDFLPSRLFGYYFTRRLQDWQDIDSGCIIRDAMLVLDADGFVPEVDWPYDDGHDQFKVRPPQALLHNALANNLDSIGSPNGATLAYLRLPRDLDRIQRCLNDGHPFVFGFSVYSSFESDKVANTGVVPVPQSSEKYLGGHLMTAVSDDPQARTILCLNSWGDTWGMTGFCSMPYSYFLNGNLSDDFWTFRPVKKEKL